MSTLTANSTLNKLITPETVTYVCRCVARRLKRKCKKPLEGSELFGWAQLGVAIAMDGFSEETAKQIDMEQPVAWVCGYLNRKAFYAAIDEMRNAHVIGRLRGGGRFYDHRVVGGVSLDNAIASLLCDEAGSADHEGVVDLKDLIGTIMSNLRGKEKEVFRLRYEEGLSVSEIAAAMGMHRAQIYTLHTSLLGRVQAYLLGNLYEVTESGSVHATAA